MATGTKVRKDAAASLTRSSSAAAYDEIELVNNENLIDEMVQVASGGDPDARLDYHAFERALTEDIKQYDINFETKLSTHFEDALGSDRKPTFFSEDDKHTSRSEEDGQGKRSAGSHPRKVNTYPFMDFMAETFRSRSHAIAVWISMPLAIYSYFYSAQTTYPSVLQ